MKTGATLHARDPWSLLVARSLEFPLGSRVLGLTFTSLLMDLAPQDLGAKPPRGMVKGLTLAFRPGGALGTWRLHPRMRVLTSIMGTGVGEPSRLKREMNGEACGLCLVPGHDGHCESRRGGSRGRPGGLMPHLVPMGGSRVGRGARGAGVTLGPLGRGKPFPPGQQPVWSGTASGPRAPPLSQGSVKRPP